MRGIQLINYEPDIQVKRGNQFGIFCRKFARNETSAAHSDRHTLVIESVLLV